MYCDNLSTTPARDGEFSASNVHRWWDLEWNQIPHEKVYARGIRSSARGNSWRRGGDDVVIGRALRRSRSVDYNSGRSKFRPGRARISATCSKIDNATLANNTKGVTQSAVPLHRWIDLCNYFSLSFSRSLSSGKSDANFGEKYTTLTRGMQFSKSFTTTIASHSYQISFFIQLWNEIMSGRFCLYLK